MIKQQILKKYCGIYGYKNKKTGKYSAVTRNYIKIHFKDERDDLRHTLKTVDLADYELE